MLMGRKHCFLVSQRLHSDPEGGAPLSPHVPVFPGPSVWPQVCLKMTATPGEVWAEVRDGAWREENSPHVPGRVG